MPPDLTDAHLTETLAALSQTGSKRAAARLLGIDPATLRYRLRRAGMRDLEQGDIGLSFQPLRDCPAVQPMFTDAELWEQAETVYKRHAEVKTARRWHDIAMHSNVPMGITWFGDPHIDDNGCNVPLLRRDIGIVAGTPGMFGANLGDTTNNWVGRLARIYADQHMTRTSARQLAESFLMRSGIDWLLVLIGNHDEWNHGSELLAAMTRNIVPLYDWQAQIRLTFPNGRDLPIWAAHDFPGNSQWNSLHGPMKAARLNGQARLYICGHRHNWACHFSEDDQRGGVFWLCRARGYKEMDGYAEKLGYGAQSLGASIVSVIDPEAGNPDSMLRCFADVQEGADFLRWLRHRAGVDDRKQ